MYDEICDIRQMFCGGATLAIAAGAVAVIGLLLFVGKADMSILLVTTVGIIIFVSADLLVESLLVPPAGAPVTQSCSCD